MLAFTLLVTIRNVLSKAAVVTDGEAAKSVWMQSTGWFVIERHL